MLIFRESIVEVIYGWPLSKLRNGKNGGKAGKSAKNGSAPPPTTQPSSASKEQPRHSEPNLRICSKIVEKIDSKAGVFYNVKNGSSFIMSKSSSENLSNQNKLF